MTPTTNIHDQINALCRQASGLAPRFADLALDSGCTGPDPVGPRQVKAHALLVEALRLNALSDDPAAVAAEGF